jgi:hypothetical protein
MKLPFLDVMQVGDTVTYFATNTKHKIMQFSMSGAYVIVTPGLHEERCILETNTVRPSWMHIDLN